MLSPKTNSSGSSMSADTQKKESLKSLPIIDISALTDDNPSKEALKHTVQAIREACCNWGFFYIVNHGVSLKLQEQLETLSKQFFALPVEQKQAISIATSGKSWRGYFSMGGELTKGKPDLKEGINFGVEYSPNDSRVLAGLPLHGPNLWPAEVPQLKDVLLEYMDTLEKLGLAIMKGVALSLNLPPDYFKENYLKDPSYRCITLNYPPDHAAASNQTEPTWGVGEHTDYGLLTILKQDNSGGLQVKSVHQGWTEAQPVENSFVCNIGDMLQTVTNGLYVSTPHRVKNVYTGKDRFSCPFFLDPNWEAQIQPLPKNYTRSAKTDLTEAKRTDKPPANSYCGRYGDYATEKFSKSFPNTK